jgi:hypothetical protein
MPSVPIEDNIRELMRDIGETLGRAIREATAKTGEQYGFALLMFAMEKIGPAGEPGSLNYISNAERPSMIEAMKEFIRNAEAEDAEDAVTRRTH